MMCLREKEEAIQRAIHGEGDRPDEDDDDDVLGDNPFKRLDLNELKEKEKKQKQQKKRRKEWEAQKTKEEEVVARGNMFNSPLHNAATASDDDIPRSQINRDMTLPTSRSSPLQSLLPSETLGDRVSGGGDKSVLPPVPKSRSIEAYGSTFEPGNLQNGTNGLKFGATHVVASVSRLEPLESGKKKKKKRNQTVPKDEDNDSMETDTQKGHHSNKVPSSEATPETKVSDFSQKWGLVDELPSLDSANYNRPNYADDENIIT
ncbi:hypothetical protein LSAT2_024402 [Lamellibrachia satsuma]|nr:hypothetical protein LSAT2_024402 [Lamellibrachia satsuma]